MSILNAGLLAFQASQWKLVEAFAGKAAPADATKPGISYVVGGVAVGASTPKSASAVRGEFIKLSDSYHAAKIWQMPVMRQ